MEPAPEVVNDVNSVIVVGGGLAGLSATIEAARSGVKVYLLEKEGRIGGNSAKATSGINAWGTQPQHLEGIMDSTDYFEADTHRSGAGGLTDQSLVKMLSLKSKEAVEWLSSFGLELTKLSQLGGHSRKRTHRAPDTPDGNPVPIGFCTISALQKYITTVLQDRVEIVYHAKVHKLLFENTGIKQHRVTGVEYTNGDSNQIALHGKSVILATGGFSNDRTDNSLLYEYAPDLSSYPTTNGPWATGDGVKMAKELGVALVDMDKVQLHPTGLVDPKDPANRTKYLGPEALRGSGGILVNKRGERFVNELDLRSVVSQAIIAQNDVYPNSGDSKFAHCILNEAAVKLFGVNSLGFYWKRLGLFVKVDDVPALAKLIGCSETAIQKTLTQYEEVSSGNRACPMTGKAVFPCKLGPQGPFYVAYVTPSIHYTMGGCLISASGEIQTEVDNEGLGTRRPILGLFGAGEVTGGVHGKNRLGGNSLLECVVFGRIAGQRAASFDAEEREILLEESRALLSVREVRVQQDEEGDSFGGQEVVLSFPSSAFYSGLQVMQPVQLMDVENVSSVILVPSSTPREQGIIRFFLPHQPMNSAATWMYDLKSGDMVQAKALHRDVALTPSIKEVAVAALSPSGFGVVQHWIRQLKVSNTIQKIRIFYDFSQFSNSAHLKWVMEVAEECAGLPNCTIQFSDEVILGVKRVRIESGTLEEFLSPSSFSVFSLEETLCVITGASGDNWIEANNAKVALESSINVRFI